MDDDALTIEEFEALVGGRVEAIEPTGVPMGITKEFLQNEIASLERQKAGALATMNAAEGAIHAYRALIAKVEKEAAETANNVAAEPTAEGVPPKANGRRRPAAVDELRAASE